MIAQLGGQTPLRLARALADGGRARCSAPPRTRSTWPRTAAASARLLDELGLARPAVGDRRRTRRRPRGAAEEVGYPVLVRPSYVLGGRAMAVCDSPEALREYLARRAPGRARCWSTASSRTRSSSTSTPSPTARDCWTAAVMEHVEAAGVHSGDSACVLPGPGRRARPGRPRSRSRRPPSRDALGAVGLLNVQFAVRDDASSSSRPTPGPRARCRSSRRRPGVPLVPARGPPDARRVARRPRRCPAAAPPAQVAVKEAVLPFARFPGADPVLGPGDAGDRRGDGRSAAASPRRSPRRSAARARRCRAGGRRSSRRATPTSRGPSPLAAQLVRAGLDAGGDHRHGGRAGGRRRSRCAPVRKVSEGSPNVVDLIAARGGRPGRSTRPAAATAPAPTATRSGPRRSAPASRASRRIEAAEAAAAAVVRGTARAAPRRAAGLDGEAARSGVPAGPAAPVSAST